MDRDIENTLINIDEHLKSCRPDSDVFTYSFTKAEVERINKALQRYDLVHELHLLINEDLIQKVQELPYDWEKNWQGRRYVILNDVLEVLKGER